MRIITITADMTHREDHKDVVELVFLRGLVFLYVLDGTADDWGQAAWSTKH